jgi:short-subunit dehydrogenase
LSLSEAVYHELRGTGVTVTTLCPGVTFTGFQERAAVGNMPLIRLGGMSAESVARIGYRAMMRGKAVRIPGLMNQLMALSSRFVPRPLVRMISHRLMVR